MITRLCRNATPSRTIFPAEYLDIPIDDTFRDQLVTIEPRVDSVTFRSFEWPRPQLVQAVGTEIRLINDTSSPIFVPKNDHLCQVRSSKIIEVPNVSSSKPHSTIVRPETPHSSKVVIDPSGQLPTSWKNAFRELHMSYDSVFEDIIGRYNDKSGKVRSRILINSVSPPTRKLRVPNYCKNNLDALQEKFDELESMGVFARPEDVGVTVEHVSPSFLVPKSRGGHRLVTNFASLVDYVKTLPTIMPTVESILRTIASWRYIIITDLRDAFYQIPMDKGSMKWCGTPTPYRGLRVYQVAVQGLPGSSEVLEELLCTVLGEYVKQGFTAKIADDLSVGGQSIQDLFDNWSKVLRALFNNGLKLKGPKTSIAPSKAEILGWLWNNGSITACAHKISPLISCKPPTTVTAMRSYVGSYKVFNRLIRGCASLLDVLEKSICGKQKSDKIVWTDKLLELFKSSQHALNNVSVVQLPRASDKLILVHDGSRIGIGSVLYLLRGEETKLGGFFSAKLKGHQSLWYPCEIEALSISASVTHYSQYIVQSDHRTQLLTDNRPCVQAWSKMKRGEFSSSARVSTSLSILSQYNVDVQFIKGTYNLPSDFQSRHPPSCEENCCQICKFVQDSDHSVVRAVSVDDVLAGREQVPFATRSSWKNLQMQCPDLRRVHAHLAAGTRPTAKKTKMTTVKRFLRNVKIARDGLLVVKQSRPFLPESELIVVPLSILHGLVTSLHLQLGHPLPTQLTNVFNRQYFSLNVADCVGQVSSNCAQYRALVSVPKELHEQTSTVQVTTPVTSFAADVMRRYRQKIFVMRDTFSSFTITCLVPDETHDSLRSAIVQAVSSVRPNTQTLVTVRADNAPGLAALKGDLVLKQYSIIIDYGRVFNKNKNPVVDKAIQELGHEMLRYSSTGGPFSNSELAYITNVLNSRLRHHGLSAWEILYQRDQFTGAQLNICDLKLSEDQSTLRAASQQYSARCKAKGNPPALAADVMPGSLVYIKSDGDKAQGRERYLVTTVKGNSCTLQKLSESKLRSKPYQLKLTEIYPVTPDLPLADENLRCDTDEDEDVVSVIDSSHRHNIAEDSLPHSSTEDTPLDTSVDTVVDHNTDAPLVDDIHDPSADDVDAGDVAQGDDLDATIAYEDVEALPSSYVHSPATVLPPKPTRASSRRRDVPEWMRDGTYELKRR